MKNFNYDSISISDFVTILLKDYFTLSQIPDFKGFEIERGKNKVFEKNPNSYYRNKLNDFANKLGLREQQLKSQIENLKQNYQLRYDDIPTEIPFHLDLDKVEKQLEEIVFCTGIISALRKEFKLIKAKIGQFKNSYKVFKIQDKGFLEDLENLEISEEQISLQKRYFRLHEELRDINDTSFVYPVFSSKIVIFGLNDNDAKELVMSAIISSLSPKTQTDFFQASSFVSIYKQLSRKYSILESEAIEGEQDSEQTVRVGYLTGNNQGSYKETKTIAKVIIPKKLLRDKAINAMSKMEQYSSVIEMVEQATMTSLNKMKEEILLGRKRYDEERNEELVKFNNNKNDSINDLKKELDSVATKFNKLEKEREFNHQSCLNKIEEQFSSLKAIVPIPNFTEKVINALV